MTWLFLILALVGNFAGFSLLKMIPEFEQSFGAKDHQWLVNAVWDLAQHFVPFVVIFNLLMGPQNRNRIKNSLPLNACLTFFCLVATAAIEHLIEYPEFHIDVKDVKQHNSIRRIKLVAAFSFAGTFFCLSRAYDLTFESGFFSLCLGYAMKVSLEFVDENGNRYIAFILVTYVFCFLVILLRKYLEKNKGNDTTRQKDDESPDNSNTVALSPNSNGKGDQRPSASSNTNDLQAGHMEPLGRLALHQHNQHEITINGHRTSDNLMADIGSSQRNTSGESWNINEQNWETVPPSLCNGTNSNSGEEEEEYDDSDEEGKDIIITYPDISNNFAEGSSASDEHVGEIQEREVPDQEIGHEKRDITSNCPMKLGSSSVFGGYGIIDGETQIINRQVDRSKDQNEESSYQGYEINENPLLPNSSPKVYNDDDPDHESFDGEESDCQEQENMNPSGSKHDGIHYEGTRKPFSDEGTIKSSNNNSSDDEGTRKPSNRDSSDDEEDDDYNSGAGCKAGGRNKCHTKEGKDITNLDDELRLASRSSDDEGSDGHDFNNGTAEVGVNQRGRNLLHMAGMCDSSTQLNRKANTALKMRKESQWFEGVKHIIVTARLESRNKECISVRELFKENHNDLVKQDEKLIKSAANFYALVASLVLSVAFATFLTIPSDNNQNTGYRSFQDHKLFKLLLIFDAISLLSSTTSLMIFLEILTSRYDKDDFLKSLLTKKIIGLSMLLISIAAMMITFSVAIPFLFLKDWIWTGSLVILFTSVPMIWIVWLHLSAVVEMYRSTYLYKNIEA